MRYAALVFDLDDTLVDSRRAYELASGAAARALGLTPEEGLPALARARGRVKERLPPKHVAARNRWLYFKEMLDAHGNFTPGALVAVMDVYESALAAELGRQWRTLGRDDVLARLGRGRQVAVVTNETLRTQVLKLQSFGSQTCAFDLLVASEELGVEKPSPTLLERALARMQLAPRDVLVVGDDVVNDIQPAVALGCAAVLTREFARPEDANQPAPPPGVPVIQSLRQLEEHV